MYVYFGMIVFSAFCTKLYCVAKKQEVKLCENNYIKKSCFFAFLAFLIPTCVSALRDYTIGTDVLGTYYDIFNIIKNGGSIRDFGYGFINKICLYFSSNYRLVIVITSVLINAFFFSAIFRESKYPVFSVILLFTTNVYFISMNMIRQSLAISLFIYAIKYIKEQNFRKYFLLIILATSIHSISIIYLPMYYIYNIKLSRKKAITLCILFLVGWFIFSNLIIDILLNLEYFNKYYAWYFNSIYNSGEVSVISLLINLVLLVFLLCIYRASKDDKDYNILLWSIVISFCILSISATIPLAQRTSWLFYFSTFVYLPNMFEHIHDKKIKFLVKISVFTGYFLYMIGTTFVLGYNEVYPYIGMLGGVQ